MSIPVNPLRGALRLLLLPLCLAVSAFAADAKRAYDLPAADAESAIKLFSQQSGRGVIAATEVVQGVKTNRVVGEFMATEALKRLLAGTGLLGTEDAKSGTFAVSRESSPEEKNAPRAAATTSDRPESNAKVEDGVVKLDTFEVMGSKLLNMDIRRSRDDAQPYVIFGRESIETSGAANLDDFFKQKLPMNTVGRTNAQVVTSFGPSSGINLRGLGANQTLVLIDGRRTGSFLAGSTPTQADLNTIPLAAIERVEVLPTTASGIYGGSATGGVINVILRRDYTGAELKTTFENTFQGDAAVRRATLTAGWSLEAGKTNLLFAASVEDSNDLLMQDRNFVQRGRATILANNPAFFLSAVTPPLGSTPNIRSSTGTNLTLKSGAVLNSPITFVPVGYAGTTGDAGAALVANAGRYNLNLANSAQVLGPSSGKQGLLNSPTTYSLALTLRRQFTPRFQAFADARLGVNEGGIASSFQLTNFTVASTAPNNPFNQAVSVSVPSSAGDGKLVATNRDRRLVVGGILKLPKDWQAALDYTWSEATSDFLTNDLGRGGGFTSAGTAAVGNGTIDVLRDTNAFPVGFDPFFAPGGFLYRPFKSTMENLSLRVAGQVGSLPGGPVQVSSLLEYRDERFAPNRQFGGGEIATEFYYASRSQSANSAYVETILPIFSTQNARPGLHTLNVQLAGRYEEYTIEGANLVSAPANTPPPAFIRASNRSSSTHPTIGLRYEPVRDVTLRASYGTGFFPPAVTQLSPGTPIAGGNVIDPRRGNTSTTGGVLTTTGGNPNLRPEESDSWSVGLVVKPRPITGLRLSVDYTRIKKSDNIATLSAQQVVDNEAFLPGRVTRGANLPGDLTGWAGPITALDRTSVNLSRAEVEAVDFTLDYELPQREMGQFTFSAVATKQLRYKTQLVPTAALLDNAGLSTTNPLDWKGNGSLTWKRGHLRAVWTVSYFDSYLVADPRLVSSVPVILNQGSGGRIPAQTYHDLFVSYQFRGAQRTSGNLAGSLLQNTELQLGLKNVFNREPPFDAAASPQFYSYYGDPRLARYSVSLGKQF